MKKVHRCHWNVSQQLFRPKIVTDWKCPSLQTVILQLLSAQYSLTSSYVGTKENTIHLFHGIRDEKQMKNEMKKQM